MNPKLKILFVLGALTIGLVGFALAKAFLFEKTPVPNSFVLLDWSDSTPDDCAAAVGLSRSGFTLPQMQRGSTVTLAVTGDESTANEPRSLGTYPVPISDKVFEGAKKNNQKLEDILSEIRGKCEQIPPVKKSSIFLAFKNAVAQLRSQGCGVKANCAILAKSDLQENVEPEIKAALRGNKASLSKLPAPIDNRGIRVTICGIAETKGLVNEPNGKSRQLTQNRNAASFDLIRQVWGGLFTEPQSVTFTSFCPN